MRWVYNISNVLILSINCTWKRGQINSLVAAFHTVIYHKCITANQWKENRKLPWLIKIYFHSHCFTSDESITKLQLIIICLIFPFIWIRFFSIKKSMQINKRVSYLLAKINKKNEEKSYTHKSVWQIEYFLFKSPLCVSQPLEQLNKSK